MPSMIALRRVSYFRAVHQLIDQPKHSDRNQQQAREPKRLGHHGERGGQGTVRARYERIEHARERESGYQSDLGKVSDHVSPLTVCA